MRDLIIWNHNVGRDVFGEFAQTGSKYDAGDWFPTPFGTNSRGRVLDLVEQCRHKSIGVSRSGGNTSASVILEMLYNSNIQ